MSSTIDSTSVTGLAFLVLYNLHKARKDRTPRYWFSFRSLFRGAAKAVKLVTSVFRTYDNGGQH